jgi:hypothetical protein
MLKGEVLELGLDLPHAQSVGDGGVDLHRLLRDPAAPVLGEMMESAHVVKPVGQLHQHHARSETIARIIFRKVSACSCSRLT